MRSLLFVPGDSEKKLAKSLGSGADALIADALVTNFHLPKTSLLIMVCAFAGYDLAMEAYKKAIKDKYRFFSYGDAMLVI